MDKTLKVINEMVEERIIQKYAIGGAIASIFYIEPVTTYDIDVIILLNENNTSHISLAHIDEWLSEKGYKPDKEHVIIEGIPVQFIPAYNPLVTEAVINSVKKKFKNTIIHVLRSEYLIAIMLDTYRAKDRERVIRFLQEAKIDSEFLMILLSKYKLQGKFKKLKL